MPRDTTFQIECETPMLLAEANALLSAMQEAYDGLAAFDTLVIETGNLVRLQRRARYPDALLSSWAWTTRQIPASEIVHLDDLLVLQRVALSSPGFLEFLGALNPLEQIRRYLNDRHQRKLHLSREPEKERKARLENDNLELRNEGLAMENLRERLNIENEFDIPRTQITVLYRNYVSSRLTALGDTVDRVNAAPGRLRESSGG